MSQFAAALETQGLRADLERRGIPIYDVMMTDGFVVRLLTWDTACLYVREGGIILPRETVHGS